jgi:GDP/UDP-N,N'-diacetylbacillosamine 2-epimerase (hydrolysing)
VFFSLKIIAFGTHLSEKFGYTISDIYNDGFDIAYKVETLPEEHSPEMISKSIGTTIVKFSEIWAKEYIDTDLVICLGDRYEMFAAVSSTIPFNIKIAHLYGGDTTLGAIDNIFRHCLTSMSNYHFTSLENSAKRVAEIIASSNNIYAVGTLSLDNLKEIELLTKNRFDEKFHIELKSPVLVTFHPETVNYSKNEEYVNELIAALETLDKQIIITMPNADTMGEIIREAFLNFASRKSNVFIVESLGTVGYFSCINLCDFMVGNSSSGIVEAASFGKYVLNIGDRQLGRLSGENVIHCEIKKDKIAEAIKQISALPKLTTKNIYGDGETADKIIAVLKTIKH